MSKIMINWWVVLILGIWFFGAVASFATKSADCIAWAGVVTILIGIGYLMLVGK